MKSARINPKNPQGDYLLRNGSKFMRYPGRDDRQGAKTFFFEKTSQVTRVCSLAMDSNTYIIIGVHALAYDTYNKYMVFMTWRKTVFGRYKKRGLRVFFEKNEEAKTFFQLKKGGEF